MTRLEIDALTKRYSDTVAVDDISFDASPDRILGLLGPNGTGMDTEELSKGMQQKIQFIATLLHNPSLLIFDEPFSGLDPINAELLRAIILELCDDGHTILFASHPTKQVSLREIGCWLTY